MRYHKECQNSKRYKLVIKNILEIWANEADLVILVCMNSRWLQLENRGLYEMIVSPWVEDWTSSGVN